MTLTVGTLFNMAPSSPAYCLPSGVVIDVMQDGKLPDGCPTISHASHLSDSILSQLGKTIDFTTRGSFGTIWLMAYAPFFYHVLYILRGSSEE